MDQVAAIRAIHQAWLQLRAAKARQPTLSELDHDSAISALALILGAAGHPAFAAYKPLPVKGLFEERETEEVRCIVTGFNAAGSPDFWFVKARCTQPEYDDGEHYAAAEAHAEENGFEPKITIDECDDGAEHLLCHFQWNTASIVTVSK